MSEIKVSVVTEVEEVLSVEEVEHGAADLEDTTFSEQLVAVHLDGESTEEHEIVGEVITEVEEEVLVGVVDTLRGKLVPSKTTCLEMKTLHVRVLRHLYPLC